jgi:hypothetical protein
VLPLFASLDPSLTRKILCHLEQEDLKTFLSIFSPFSPHYCHKIHAPALAFYVASVDFKATLSPTHNSGERVARVMQQIIGTMEG